MNELLSPIAALKLIALLIVLAAAYQSRLNRYGSRPFIITVTAATLAVQHMRQGPYGLVFALAGTAAAFILTFPLLRLRLITTRELVVSCIVGCVIGPAGYAAAFVIAVTLLTVQHIMKAYMTRLNDRLFSSRSIGKTIPAVAEERSAIADIEAKRILRSENTDLSGSWWPRILSPENRGILGNMRRESIFPWSAKLTLAVLSVFMLGLPL